MPPDARPIVERVLETAEREGLAVHLVGGPVRDFLLGRSVRDVDLVVEPSGGRDAQWLAEQAAPKEARIVRHARFRTAKIRVGQAGLDLATVRSEGYARPGSLPRVLPGTLEEDLERRDFTANALAIPLTVEARKGRGAIIDPGRGVEDLRACTLRVFHTRSFHDDPTRALRAARLAPRLGFRLARPSRSALRSALRDGAFGAVTGERYRAEIERVFEDALLGLDPARALRHLAEWHVLPALEPGLSMPSEAVAPVRRLGRQLAEPPWPAGGQAWMAGLMLWLAPLEAGLRRRVLSRLALRGEAATRIAGFRRSADGWTRALGRARGRGAADVVLRALGEEELLALAARVPPNLRRRIVRFASEDRAQELPVRGEDLMELGLQGPQVGRALARIRMAVLDGGVRTRDEALALARELGPGGRGRRRG